MAKSDKDQDKRKATVEVDFHDTHPDARSTPSEETYEGAPATDKRKRRKTEKKYADKPVWDAIKEVISRVTGIRETMGQPASWVRPDDTCRIYFQWAVTGILKGDDEENTVTRMVWSGVDVSIQVDVRPFYGVNRFYANLYDKAYFRMWKEVRLAFTYDGIEDIHLRRVSAFLVSPESKKRAKRRARSKELDKVLRDMRESPLRFTRGRKSLSHLTTQERKLKRVYHADKSFDDFIVEKRKLKGKNRLVVMQRLYNSDGKQKTARIVWPVARRNQKSRR